MHEHVFVLTPDMQQNYPDEWGSEDERVADAVTKLRALASRVSGPSSTPPSSASVGTSRASSGSQTNFPS